jgi:hypothetical protein
MAREAMSVGTSPVSYSFSAKLNFCKNCSEPNSEGIELDS